MARDISWNFVKINLQRDLPVEKKRETLVERFLNADTYERNSRGAQYRFQLCDVEHVKLGNSRRWVVLGHLIRAPKVAHGLDVDQKTRRSKEGAVDVPDIADYTEFVYDLKSCVLAYHHRYPFQSPRIVADVFKYLLGTYIDKRLHASAIDVHAEVLRDSQYVETILDGKEDLVEVSLEYAKPNPGSGDDSLDVFDLGLIGEDTEADRLRFSAKKLEGTLDKSKDGFIRRSIRALLGKGYLRKGRLLLENRSVDVLHAKEKERETEGYTLDDNGKPFGLSKLCERWVDSLIENTDIYGNHDE